MGNTANKRNARNSAKHEAANIAALAAEAAKVLAAEAEAARVLEAEAAEAARVTAEIAETLVTAEMLARVRTVLGEHGTCFHTGEKFVIAVAVTQYLQTDLTQWKKFITNGYVRWGSNVEFEKALQYVSGKRSINARGAAHERFRVASALAATKTA